MEPLNYKLTLTTKFFHRMCFIAFIFGYPNFWIEDLKCHKLFCAIYSRVNIVINILICIFLFFEFGAFYTQKHLNETQSLHLSVYTIATLVFCIYYFILTYHNKLFKMVLLELTVNLKAVHNDSAVEKQMIQKSLTYLTALLGNLFLVLLLINAEAYMETRKNNTPFTTIITAYPNVLDSSTKANTCRVIFNIIYWLFYTRVLGTYALVTPLTTCLSHQYKNLQSYFYNLSEIFERQDLVQKEKEDEYIKGFKFGIKMHLNTLRCTGHIHTICNVVFSSQIVINVILLVLLMAQTAGSDRNLALFFSTVTSACAVLVTTGLFMWNAGDITIEASRLSTAIYFSGWHNCYGQSTLRIRKLVTTTMSFTQSLLYLYTKCVAVSWNSLSCMTIYGSVELRRVIRILPGNAWLALPYLKPVILRGLGYIELSYESYLTIAKSSYSVFSVLF